MSSQHRGAAPGSDSQSESEGEEETNSKVNIKQQEPPKQQQQQGEAESESESESESDESSDSEPAARYNSLKRVTDSKVATKGPVPDNKRGRDVNGAKGSLPEKPSSKKRKAAKDEKAHSQPQEMQSLTKKGVKAEQATKGTKATAAAAKVKKAKVVLTQPAPKVENAKPQTAGRKRKASPPPPPSSARQEAQKVEEQAQKVEVDRSSPLKPKKTAASWTTAVEEFLVNQLHKDHSNGFVIPSTRNDPYWEKLLKRLPLKGDMTEFQLSEKVRRMKSRYHILKERPKGEGGKLFKSPHEEKIFQLWSDIWRPAMKPLQPDAEEEDSEDELAEITTAPRQVSKSVAGQVKAGDSSSDDEDEEEEAENAKLKTPGLNPINSASKVIPESPVVSPFISKPRLAFTPRVPKEGKRNVFEKIDEDVASGDQPIEDVVARDDGKKGDVVFLANEHLKQLRDESLAFFQELRVNCFQAVEEQRNGSLTGGLGNFAFAGKGFGFSGVPEGFITGSGSQEAVKLQKKWGEYKIQELALLSERLQLLQEQCHLQIQELKQQNQKLDQ